MLPSDTMKDETEKKPGPDPETLNIEEDPGEALDRLLGFDPKKPKPKGDRDDEDK